MAIKVVMPDDLEYFKTKQDEANIAKFSAKQHKHNMSDITSGILGINQGGTGASTLASAVSALSVFNNAIKLSQVNLDEYHGEGMFGAYYGAGGNGCDNRPSGVDNFGLIVFRSADGWSTQLLYGSNNFLYTRAYTTDSWSEWSQISNTPITISTSAAPSTGTPNTLHVQLL